MCQEKILLYLAKRRDKWVSVKELSEGLNLHRSCVVRNLKSLRKWDQVQWRVDKVVVGNRTNRFLIKHKQ